MSADLATLERRQQERITHRDQLQALIDARQLEIDNLRTIPQVTQPVQFKLRSVK